MGWVLSQGLWQFCDIRVLWVIKAEDRCLLFGRLIFAEFVWLCYPGGSLQIIICTGLALPYAYKQIIRKPLRLASTFQAPMYLYSWDPNSEENQPVADVKFLMLLKTKSLILPPLAYIRYTDTLTHDTHRSFPNLHRWLPRCLRHRQSHPIMAHISKCSVRTWQYAETTFNNKTLSSLSPSSQKLFYYALLQLQPTTGIELYILFSFKAPPYCALFSASFRKQLNHSKYRKNNWCAQCPAARHLKNFAFRCKPFASLDVLPHQQIPGVPPASVTFRNISFPVSVWNLRSRHFASTLSIAWVQPYIALFRL